jgi:choline dehydrogenase
MSTLKHASLVTLLTYGSLVFALPQAKSSAAFANPDYVIVGGGPAGYVLAEQLSADPNVNVVLLEAGPDTAGNKNVDTPGYAPNLLHTPYTWNYTCQPDPNLNGVSPSLDQGRGFGGGSAVNYLGHCRGAPSVFDEWAKISDDEGLRWENFLEDYKATVHYKEEPLDYDPHINKSVYGNGPIEITAENDDLGFISNLVKSWSNVLKLPLVDLNDGTGLGVSSGPSVIRASNRTRDYAPQAYGRQIHNAEVTKIGFEGKRAVSVTYVNPIDNSTTTLMPKEVIVSAGAIGSPKVRSLGVD